LRCSFGDSRKVALTRRYDPFFPSGFRFWRSAFRFLFSLPSSSVAFFDFSSESSVPSASSFIFRELSSFRFLNIFSKAFISLSSFRRAPLFFVFGPLLTTSNSLKDLTIREVNCSLSGPCHLSLRAKDCMRSSLSFLGASFLESSRFTYCSDVSSSLASFCFSFFAISQALPCIQHTTSPF
uniref:Secreted protein n=1 Tax=Haemonchus placei TaxID=6290 RepID=A0A0N4X790_HAEPC